LTELPARLAADVQALQVAGFADRGIGRYTAGHVAALARAGRIAAALLAPELPPPAGIPDELSTSGLACWDTMRQMRDLLRSGGPIARYVTAPFLHSGPTDSCGLTVVPHWADAGVPRLVTLYDLIPLRDPETYLPTPSHRERYEARAKWVAEADLVLAISEFTRTEAIELLACQPDRVVTIGAGVSPMFTPPDGTDDELFRFYLPGIEGRPFLLTIGGSDPRKGTERLIDATGRLLERGLDLSLVVVGDLTDWWQIRLREAASSAGLGERLVLTGPVADALLRACYRRAAVTVLPSTSEGFGLPALESAACGTPALTSCTTALPEVAVSDLATFDPLDAESIAEAVGALLADDGRRAEILGAQRELASRSTWDAVAVKTIAALDSLCDSIAAGDWGRAPDRRRIALVGPLPPLGGGIGAYNARLLEAVSKLEAVDAVTPMVGVPDLPPGVGHLPADSFGTDVRPVSYDGVVYAVGNSGGHLGTIELALRFPGWVWLHEVRLPAVAVTALEKSDDVRFAESLAWLLERAYPHRAPVHAAERAGRSVLDLTIGGVGLTPLLAERCRGFLVNSNVARNLLLLDLAPLVHRPPIHVLPPACPPVRELWEGAASGQAVVVAFGVVSMAKRPDLLVDAAAIAGCRLAFVGPCPPILAQLIRERASERAISGRVEVTGEVDGSEWDQWFARAALAVQIRESSSGESSAAVLEALAAGVPVLTNVASAAEYGDEVVSFLRTSDPALLAARIAALLDSPAKTEALSRSGKEFAATHQFEDLARSIVGIIGDS